MEKTVRQYYEKLREIGITLNAMKLPPAFDNQTALINIDLESMIEKIKLAVSGGKQHMDINYPHFVENTNPK